MRTFLQVFRDHPLQSKDEYCNATDNTSLAILSPDSMQTPANKAVYKDEPNTALLSTILMFGTFMIAYGLKLFRNGKYMGRTVKRL